MFGISLWCCFIRTVPMMQISGARWSYFESCFMQLFNIYKGCKLPVLFAGGWFYLGCLAYKSVYMWAGTGLMVIFTSWSPPPLWGMLLLVACWGLGCGQVPPSSKPRNAASPPVSLSGTLWTISWRLHKGPAISLGHEDGTHTCSDFLTLHRFPPCLDFTGQPACQKWWNICQTDRSDHAL